MINKYDKYIRVDVCVKDVFDRVLEERVSFLVPVLKNEVTNSYFQVLYNHIKGTTWNDSEIKFDVKFSNVTHEERMVDELEFKFENNSRLAPIVDNADRLHDEIVKITAAYDIVEERLSSWRTDDTLGV